MTIKATRLNPNKLLHSKWTALQPMHKEKHFMVTKVIKPLQAQGQPLENIEWVEIEAVFSKRAQLVRWQTLTDASIWLQGWL